MPSCPASRNDVPVTAWRALEQACGELALDRMLVIPGTGKPTLIGGQLAMRTRVLAFGADAVGHWTDDTAGTVESMRLDDLLAIDDRLILLDGRLTLIGTGSRMSIRYNAVARPVLRQSVMWLRGRIAGRERATRSSFTWVAASGGGGSPAELPYKWAYLLTRSADLRIDPPDVEMVAVGDVVEHGVRRRGPATGLAVLGPRDLVVAAEPPASPAATRYGVDLTVVPRANLRDVGWRRGDLRIRLRSDHEAGEAVDALGNPGAEGPSISRPLDGRLYEAMKRSFGDALEWS